MRLTRSDGGFTMVELVMAIFIASIVMGGLAGISAMAARNQARDYRHGVVGDNLSLAMKYIESDLYPTSTVVPPVSGSTTTWNDQLCMEGCSSTGSSAPCGYQSSSFFSYSAASMPSGSGLNTYIVYYCRVNNLNPNWSSGMSTQLQYIGTLYRYDSSGTTDLSCSSPPSPCGSGNSVEIAVNIDSMTIAQSSFRNQATVSLYGSWYSAATGTNETLQLQTNLAWYAPWEAGP